MGDNNQSLWNRRGKRHVAEKHRESAGGAVMIKTLKKKFSEVSLSQFSRSESAIKPIPFRTTYLYESGFSSLVELESKQRNRLYIEHDLR